MRVHLIKKQTIHNYVDGHAPGKSSFENWVTTVKYVNWENPENIRQTFGSAHIQNTMNSAIMAGNIL